MVENNRLFMSIESNGSFVMAERLRALREARGLSHYKLSKALEDRYDIKISSDSLMNYEVADANHSKKYKNMGMRVEYLRCLAKFYGVSTDYLLGLAEEQTPDPTIQSACRYTGLSEKAIEVLCHHGEQELQDGYQDLTHGIAKQLLNLLIESHNFYVIMVLLRQCLAAYTVKSNQKSLFTGGDYMDAERIVAEAGRVILKSSEAADFYANKAADYLKTFAHKEIRAFAEHFCEK